MNKSFKPIPGYEDLYLINENGDIFGISRQKFLRLSYRKEYPRVKLFKDNKGKSIDVHRLVAITFLANPNNLPCVMHIDDNPKNNKITNLKWCTHLENMQDMYLKGRRKTHARRIQNVQTEEIFRCAKDAALKYNCAISTIRQSCNEGYKCKGFNWIFID